MEKEKTEIYSIPENFEDGFVLFSNVYSIKEVLFALIMAALTVMLMLSVNIYQTKTARISATVTAGFTSLIACLIHINGNSIPDFLKLLLHYQRRKRIYYYNPRIKEEKSRAFFLPEMKINNPVNEETATTEISEESTSVLYFREDRKYVAVPTEYMNLFQRMRNRKKIVVEIEEDDENE